MQRSLLPLVGKDEILDAWQWLLTSMKPRPTTVNCPFCIYDHKEWGNEGVYLPLKSDSLTVKRLGVLYLTSELGDDDIICKMVNGGIAENITDDSLDGNVYGVLTNPSRFRDALSEHLAFWVRLASAAQTKTLNTRFACSLPNPIPENQGPDGLFLSIGEIDHVEIQSVKNSERDPRRLIATRKFRQYGVVDKPKEPKQLEDFWLNSNKKVGIVYLQRYLTNLCKLLELEANRLIRMGLLAKCSYNAVVVADNKHAKSTLFEGYEHVTDDVNRHVATYIGSESWVSVAEETRKLLVKRLRLTSST